jgi:hypothetical protein
MSEELRKADPKSNEIALSFSISRISEKAPGQMCHIFGFQLVIRMFP